jgi:hypothetical protein
MIKNNDKECLKELNNKELWAVLNKAEWVVQAPWAVAQLLWPA